MNSPIQQLAEDGFSVIAGAIAPGRVVECLEGLTAALVADESEAAAVRSSRGAVYAARNVLELWPEAAVVWRTDGLTELLRDILGPRFGLVRVLFFDKPPDRTWSLGWHKDLSIAVADNSLPSEHFSNPTLKAGVPHVIAPSKVLEKMLTLRIHLDEVTDENGPLLVVPGSQRSGKGADENPRSPVTIHAQAGDVLAMRPLLSHASGNSVAGTTRHRRILHLEFAASALLPDGYRWHTFIPA